MKASPRVVSLPVEKHRRNENETDRDATVEVE